jgi:maltooligosyltrehalose trehalohydrolase
VRAAHTYEKRGEMAEARRQRRLPVGAEPFGGQGVHVRVWAPRRRRVEVVFEPQDGGRASRSETPRSATLEPEEAGYFSALVDGVRAGARYRFRLDDDPTLYPDPASRFQPEGPHGPSCVVDPGAFAWTDAAWRGPRLAGQVAYEMHIGTFTREGTWAAATRELPELAALGVTLLEVMPVAEFPGRFGWGYDGVDLFAPTRLYGAPDDFRRFVDRAHALGLGVILDVVYNHFGPDGNYLKQFAHEYFTDRYANEWGEAVNYDGPGSGPVREFVVGNAGYWIDEFHLDGLRLDATQTIHDNGPGEHLLAAVSARVRAAAGGRATLLVAENEPQHARLVRPRERGGYGLDALWNDDFHHSATVAATGRCEAYYRDTLGSPQELIAAVKWGYLYQGQRYLWQGKRRGAPALDVPPAAFVLFLENHDQVANSARGRRLHQLTSPGRHRALTALLLLAPGTPMLFQGQEFAASSPFLYFADHEPALAALVTKGRGDFLAQFPSIARPEVRARLATPSDPATFERSKLDLTERARHAAAYALHRDLLALRRDDPVFRAQRPRGLDGAVLGPEAFVLRYFDPEHGDRLLIVNLGRDLDLRPAPEPLLAPPEGARWAVRWSSEDPTYDGDGAPHPESAEGDWYVPGHAAVVLVPVDAATDAERATDTDTDAPPSSG